MTTTSDSRSTSLEPLRLQGVLFSGIRDGVEEDPRVEKYTVPAILSRRPTPAERRLMAQVASAGHLAAAGYPDVELILSDRRLDITNTSLEELKSGLALLLGALVRDLAERAREAVDSDADFSSRPAESKRERLRRAAAEIQFY
ncbi:hypothetical protein [Arthrobacter sp. Y-9]|uniref:hypothetical protein n=1 Tax=Arthrobacter sp. Y-9 TaxID=3039385 RepID=UPI00241C864B|nr:hypothetical protein [Arthrobacter sp. Y-9]WFR84512.1 hypothetical protein P9849_02375 [Arthrobacter sp. Y-9]